MKKCLLLVALAACLAVEADAATLTIEDVTVVEGTSNTATIRVFASGGESITAFTAPLLIAGDGGGDLGGVDLPNQGGFIAGSFDTSFGLMTNAGSNYDPFVGETLSAGAPLLADPSFGNLNPSSSSVVLDGSELFRFDVDISGLVAGDSQTYTFDFDNLVFPGAAPSFNLFGGGEAFAVNGGGGSVTIAPVPSPTGVAGLLSLGLVGLGSGLRRRRRVESAATAA